MSIRAKCPSCGKGVKAPNKYVGKTAKCPGCGNEIRFPALKTVADIAGPPGERTPRVSFFQVPLRTEFVAFGLVLLAGLVTFDWGMLGRESASKLFVDTLDPLANLIMLAAAFVVGSKVAERGWWLFIAYLLIFPFAFNAISPSATLGSNFGAWLYDFGYGLFHGVIGGSLGALVAMRRAEHQKEPDN